MKKKLLPYILGCSLMAAMPLAAHAETYFHTGNDIEKTGTTTNYADWNDDSATKPAYQDDSLPPIPEDGHNEFTEYNSAVNESTGTQNKRSMTFGTPAIQGGAVDWTTNPSILGNTRNATSVTQGSYPVSMKNETQNLRAADIAAGTPSTLIGDLTNASFNTNDNDYAYDDTEGDYVDKINSGRTDLETAVPVFDMTIPAKTVLPMGATHWRLGNVKINGQYFVRPDKVDVTISHEDFKHTDYDPTESDTHKAAHSIVFTVSDKRYTDADLDSTDHRYFFQNGDGHMQDHFPYAYDQYTSQDYEAGFITDINETHQVWLNAAVAQWAGKTAGKYTGSITFNAAVVTTDSDTVPTMYTDYYPAEGAEVQP